MVETIISHFGPSFKGVDVGHIAYVAKDKPLQLECGAELSHFPLAYQTYGEFNADKSNVVLVCHGLTGDQYLSGIHPVTGKKGWWDSMVGEGNVFDTSRYFIICINVLGGCMGSLGPKDINPETGKRFNLDFPVLTIRDMVNAQKLLLDVLEIPKLMAVIGPSMGAMQALEWVSTFPDYVESAVVIAGAAHHTAQNIALHEVGRQSIMADPEWAGGRYLDEGSYPSKGLAVARMTAHVTYLSEAALQRKFGRELQDRGDITYGFEADFQVESYLRYQGITFVDRFDANSYLYITRAMDYFDLPGRYNGVLADAFSGTHANICVVSFSSDWLFTTEEARLIVHALNAVSARVSFVEIETDSGHDAFLLDEPEFSKTLGGFLEGVASRKGV